MHDHDPRRAGPRSIATCAAVTSGMHYARCQRRGDTPPPEAGQTTSKIQTRPAPMTARPSMRLAVTPSGAPQIFSSEISAADSVSPVAFPDDRLTVTLKPGESESTTCFTIELASASSTGCLHANLLRTGLAYGAIGVSSHDAARRSDRQRH